MSVKTMTGKTIRELFLDFHNQNPHVYKMFSEQVFRALDAGRKRFSAKAIFEWLRWELAFKTTDPQFKLNNNYPALYARLFIQQYPQHENLFEMRGLRAEGYK